MARQRPRHGSPFDLAGAAGRRPDRVWVGDRHPAIAALDPAGERGREPGRGEAGASAATARARRAAAFVAGAAASLATAGVTAAATRAGARGAATAERVIAARAGRQKSRTAAPMTHSTPM